MSQLLDEILSSENMKLAYKKVKANKGASGIDGITTDEVSSYLKEHWLEIKEQIKKRKYKPQPVRRVEIPVMDIERRTEQFNSQMELCM